MNKPALYPKKFEGFLIEQIDDETVLLHPVKNLIIHANETATLIWQLCDGHRTGEEIINILSSAYEEARTQIAVDVPEIIQQLRAQGALRSD